MDNYFLKQYHWADRIIGRTGREAPTSEVDKNPF